MPSTSLSPATTGDLPPIQDSGLTLSEFTRYLTEILDQPSWRAKADKEMDYVDGNQLDSELLHKQRDLGIPPAVEPLVGEAIESVLGFEAKTRTDWRLSADDEGTAGDDVAKALNYKLNQAERQSKADRACSDAFKPQLCVGIGWVEVARESDPFKYPYRVRAVHRNEIWWDWKSREPDLSDARYLIRRRWTDADQVKLKFKNVENVAGLVDHCIGGFTDRWELTNDGGTTPGLHDAWASERGWSIEESEWRDSVQRRVCLFECWYRKWEEIVVIRLLDGRVMEYDKTNPVHTVAIASGVGKPQRAVVARMYCSYWMGPHKLHDGPTPYRHHNFPYVAFWGAREDRTGVPIGRVRGMIYMQDNVNASLAKIRWGLSAVRTERTKGAYTGTDSQFRKMIARVDADIVLDAEHMRQPGARFDVKRDFELSEQQYKMLQDSRAGIQRASGITAGFQGQQGTARSGIQEQTQVEQTTQSLAALMDNFRYARTQVGELLLSLIIEDTIKKQETVVIKGGGLVPDKTVQLNVPVYDEELGMHRMDNDVERIRLKVALDDVPSTSSFRAQQLSALSEAVKSMPQEIQVVCMPHLLALMDVPHREEIIAEIRAARSTMTEEQVQQRINQALKDAQYDLKSRELEAKYNPERMAAEVAKMHAEISSKNADAGKKFMELMFAGMQAAEVVTAIPQVAPVADALIDRAASGKVGPGDIPQPAEGPAPGQIVKPVNDKRTGVGFVPGAGEPGGPAAGDTSPTTPANPASPFEGANHGIETMRADSVQP